MHKLWRVTGAFRQTHLYTKLLYTSHPSNVSPLKQCLYHSKHYRQLSNTSSILPTTLVERAHEISSSDTIFALSTAPGKAAIAIIRVSGPSWLSIYQQICPSTKNPKPRTPTIRKLYHPRDQCRVLDSGALVLHFPAPNTVTGEDILEFHVHGGPAIVRSVLDAIGKCTRDEHDLPIRPAEPGEFTKRAFYNDKIDLTQAEALGESLAAETEQQQRLAVSGATSNLSQRYEEWRRMLLYARGELEAFIDFSEDQYFDESPAYFINSISAQVRELKGQLDLHIRNATRGELLRDGIVVSLLGAPNAGKSSLLNRLVGREAAIVSAEAGTTRDIVDVSVDLGGWLVRFGDTAGLRGFIEDKTRTLLPYNNLGVVETEGIKRARKRALSSDLVIVLLALEFDVNGALGIAMNEELLSSIEDCRGANKQMLFVINKIDLLHHQTASSRRSISSILSKLMDLMPSASPNDIFCVSCKDADTVNPHEPDPGGMQTFISGLIKKFQNMTAAISGDISEISEQGKNMTPAEARSYWTASLAITHRQSAYLQECFHHLVNFLVVTHSDSNRLTGVDSCNYSHHTDGHNDLVGEMHSASVADASVRRDNDSPYLANQAQTLPLRHSTYSLDIEPEIDVVTAAEHLRYAADSLARITGRGEGGDVEDVLGVVFEK